MIEYNNKKIDFTNKNTSGVQVPDGMITVGATNTYKLLEALNLDWKNIDIPWAKYIERWNSAFPNAMSGGDNPETINSSPFNSDGTNRTKSDYLHSLEYEWNNLTNSIDWLRRNYDYLTDNGYTFPNPNNEDDPYVGIPNWAEDGKIHNSEDIVDVLNYLLWRIVNLDYFTAHWDQRNSIQTFLRYGIGWTDDYSIESIGKMYDNEDDYYNKESKQYYSTGSIWYGDSYIITLEPNINTRTSGISVLFDTDVFKWYINNLGISIDTISSLIFPFIISNSPGNIVLNSSETFPDNTITITDFERVNHYGENPDINYAFKTDIKVIGTGNYNLPETWFNDYFINNSLNKFDPYEKRISFEILQKGTTDSNTGHVFSDSDPEEIAINIQKSVNTLNSLNLFNVNILTSSSANYYTNNKYGNIYVSSEDNAVNIPFKTNSTPDNGYEITFDLFYGSSFGVSPYFAIKGSSTEITTINYDSNHKFVSCSSSTLGTIELKNGKYYFTPPEQPLNSDSDKIITVYYAFYYNDASSSRQLTPVLGEFRIRLTGRITNRIIFIPEELRIDKYNVTRLEFTPTILSGNFTVLSNGANNYYDNFNYPVSYCVRTIEYDQSLDSNNLKNIFFNNNVVTTYCSNDTDINVEYLGFTYSNSINERVMNIIDHPTIENAIDTDNSNITNSKGTYLISKNDNVKVGPDYFDNNIYYSEDVSTNYNISTTVLESIKTREKILFDTDLDNIEFSGLYTNENIENSNLVTLDGNSNYNFKILSSTAQYPLENGIIKDPDTEEYVDADNDYWFLIFRITTPEGSIGNISFTPAEGYYFLRVLRKENTVSLAFTGDTTQQIIYTSSAGDSCSFRLMPRIPIYLNRLFTQNSQNALKNMKGKFYWEFYGNNNSGEAFQLDPTVVALKDTTTNEEFIKIYNEGDTCKFKAYTDSTPNSYNQYINYVPENGNIIDFGVDGTDTIEHFNTLSLNSSSSGAILWVNKLMHATNNSENPYEAIINPYVSFLLKLSIGNSEKYIRFTNSSIFSLTIHKRIYDIDFQLHTQIGTNHGISFLNTGKTQSNPYELYEKDAIKNHTINKIYPYTSTNNDSTIKEHPLYLTSNEFGQGSENEDAEVLDKVVITLDSNDNPVLSLENILENISITPSIGLYGINVNSDSVWIVDDEYTVPQNYTKSLLLLYFLANSSSSLRGSGGNEPRYGAINLWGVNENGQSPDLIQFTISGDEYGLYDEKTLNLYVKVKDSSVDVDETP